MNRLLAQVEGLGHDIDETSVEGVLARASLGLGYAEQIDAKHERKKRRGPASKGCRQCAVAGNLFSQHCRPPRCGAADDGSGGIGVGVIAVVVSSTEGEVVAPLAPDRSIRLEIRHEHAAHEEQDVELGAVQGVSDESQIEDDAGPRAELVRGGVEGEDEHGAPKLNGKGPQVGVVWVRVSAIDGVPDGVGERNALVGPALELAHQRARVRRDARGDGDFAGPQLRREQEEIGHDGGHEQYGGRGHKEALVPPEDGRGERLGKLGRLALMRELRELDTDGVARDDEEDTYGGDAGNDESDEGELDESRLFRVLPTTVDIPRKIQERAMMPNDDERCDASEAIWGVGNKSSRQKQEKQITPYPKEGYKNSRLDGRTSPYLAKQTVRVASLLRDLDERNWARSESTASSYKRNVRNRHRTPSRRIRCQSLRAIGEHNLSTRASGSPGHSESSRPPWSWGGALVPKIRGS